MEKNALTREVALARFQAAKEKKRACLKHLEEQMKQQYERKTGHSADFFFAM